MDCVEVLPGKCFSSHFPASVVILYAVLSETSKCLRGQIVSDTLKYALVTPGCLKRVVSHIDMGSVCSIAIGLCPTAQDYDEIGSVTFHKNNFKMCAKCVIVYTTLLNIFLRREAFYLDIDKC